MKAFRTNILIEFKLFYRNFANIFFVIAFPLMMLFIFGEIFGNEASQMFGGKGTVDASVPGYIVMIMCVTGLMTTPITMSTYREKKILKIYKTTPLGTTNLILTQLVVNAIMTIVGILILILAGYLVYHIKINGSFLEIAFSILLSLLSVFSIGFFIASVAPSAKVATVIANVIYFPMIFLSGATMPLETLPDNMKKAADFLPITHAVKMMKAVFAGEHFWSEKISLMIVLGVIVLCSVLAIRLFKWENK